ncbi:MAG: diheme cytochrome c [Desulfobacula sp.]|nr:diheme cytochrome c [Desulfobacula sp.]
MDHKTMLFIFCLIFGILFSIPSFLAYADYDHKENKWGNLLAEGKGDNDDSDHQKRKQDRHRDGDHGNSSVKSLANPTYQAQCGACHFAYQPEFLPESSWTKILTSLDDHFGESVELDAESEKTILDYLKSNSADHSTTKRAAKIMKEIGNQIPLRITQIPYIIKEHHEISQDVLKREAIGSLSNCIACHTTAEGGIYDDDNVKIPK